MRKRKQKVIKLTVFGKPKSPEDRARLQRLRKIEEHRNAIVGADAARQICGDKWADKIIAYRLDCLERLGVKP